MKNLDPYVYENSSVLKNKLGITDGNKLEEAENIFVPFRIVALRKQNFTITSVFDIKKIHKFVFEPLFEWAGEFRTITIYKREQILDGSSVDYTPWDYIESEMEEADKKFKAIKWNLLTRREKLEKIGQVIQEIWQIHCFREGNTRTVALFLYFLIKQNNIHINSNFISKNSVYFRNSLVLASLYSRSKFEFLNGIIEDSTSFQSIVPHRYESINGLEIKKYSYVNHTIEKLKTIKSIKDLE